MQTYPIDDGVRIPATAKGLNPKHRKQAIKQPGKKLTGNQWQNTPMQNAFMAAWLDPKSATFGNAHKSAVQAGYSKYYALVVSAPSVGNAWLANYLKATNYDKNHIQQLLQSLANDPSQFNNSRSPADTRIKAIEVLAKVLGLTDSKQNTVNVNIVQPILGGQSVKRVDVEQN